MLGESFLPPKKGHGYSIGNFGTRPIYTYRNTLDTVAFRTTALILETGFTQVEYVMRFTQFTMSYKLHQFGVLMWGMLSQLSHSVGTRCPVAKGQRLELISRQKHSYALLLCNTVTVQKLESRHQTRKCDY